jgi:hypothetical protein
VNLIHLFQNIFQRLADVNTGIIVRISIKRLKISWLAKMRLVLASQTDL